MGDMFGLVHDGSLFHNMAKFNFNRIMVQEFLACIHIGTYLRLFSYKREGRYIRIRYKNNCQPIPFNEIEME